MRILIVNHEFPPIGGGASSACWYLSSALVKLGHDVSVLTSSFKDFSKYEVKNGVSIYRVSAIRKAIDSSNIFEMATFIFSSLFGINNIIKETGAQKIIAFFTIPAGVVSFYTYKKNKIPYLVLLRGGDVPGLVPGLDIIHKILTPIRRKILTSARNVVANSVGLQKLSEKHDPIRVNVVTNGVDTRFFCPTKKIKQNNNFRFLFVGRLHSQKNLFFLLDQIYNFKKNTKAKFILDIVGDGPQKVDLKKYSENIGLRNAVKWFGWVNKNELKKLYQSSDCLLNVSLYEGMSNVILESMACGLPVIASDIPGNNEVVRNGNTGFLFDLNNSAGFQTLLNVVVKEREKRLRIGKNARKLMVEKFSWKKVANSYIKLF